MRFLLEEGFEVVPVNPALTGQTLLGLPVYPSLAEVPGPVDMADIFRDSLVLPEITEALIGL
jgi:predicted CoA-binding protein